MTLQTGCPQGVNADVWSLVFAFLRSRRVSPGLAGACQELTWLSVFFKGQSWTDVRLSLDVPHSRGNEATGVGSFERQPSIDWFSISRGEVMFLHPLCSSRHNWLQSDWGGSFLSKVFATQAGGPGAHKIKPVMVVYASNPRAMEATTEGSCGSLAS